MTRQQIAAVTAGWTMAVTLGTVFVLVRRAIPPVVQDVLNQLPTTENRWRQFGPPIAVGALVLIAGVWALQSQSRGAR